MKTRIFENTKLDIKEAAKLIKNGETVIFPTETVYGLGANALDKSAVKKIFTAKGRPSDNPLIVHLADFELAKQFVQHIPQSANIIAEKFWPGPITMILKKKSCIPDEVSAGLDTVGIRIPGDETARMFLKECGVPVAAPSANVSGRPSPTNFQHVLEDMDGRVGGIIKGEKSYVGVESTVIDLTAEVPTILRPGGISLEQLQKELGEVLVSSEVKEDNIPKAPGMKYKHYSPKGQTFILKGTVEERVKFLKKRGAQTKVVALTFDEIKDVMPQGVEAVSLGSISSPKDAAANLFDALRTCDKLDANEIYAPEIPDDGLWRAVKNRLYKAAGKRIVDAKHLKSILFVCTGNTCRSPMAEGLFNISGLNAVASSAGLYVTEDAPSQNAVEAALMLGADIKNHKPRQLTMEMLKNSDTVITMTAAQKQALSGFENVVTFAEFTNTPFDILDPYGGDICDYEKCAKQIKEMIEKIKL